MRVIMKTNVERRHGRYLLFLDILGFRELVKSRSTQEIYAVIDSVLRAFRRWEELNGLLKTIYFSDTIIFYQEPKGYGPWAFLDVYGIGAMVLSALLAAGIPARGAISFGEFEVESDSAGRHLIYYGRALIEAYEAEKSEKWIGITITPSAWQPYEEEAAGVIDGLAGEKVWLRREDGVLLLNPFIKLRSWHHYIAFDEVKKPYSLWDAPEFPNDIRGFKFLRETAKAYAEKNDFTGHVAIKYHTTICFLEAILGRELYAWGEQAALPGNF